MFKMMEVQAGNERAELLTFVLVDLQFRRKTFLSFQQR